MAKEILGRIIPKPRPIAPRWINTLFWLAWIGLIILVGLFIFLKSQTASLKETVKNLESEMGKVGTSGQREAEKGIIEKAQKINRFSELFKAHKITSKFFNFLAALCHPKVQFISLGLDSQTGAISLRGVTENFQTLGEQFLLLKNNENIKELAISNISLGEDGKVNFNLAFILPQNFFEK